MGLQMNNIAQSLSDALISCADAKMAETGKNFFKEDIRLYGVKSSDVRKISKSFFKEIEYLSKQDILDICETLWQTGWHEEAVIACNWSYYIHKQYTVDDFNVFDRWLNSYVSNWAACDTLCNHTIGTIVEMYPQLINDITAWCASANRWVRRGAAVTLIIPARKGLFQQEIFGIADKLLQDKDDLVQKGYGWMLKAASEADCGGVYDFVSARKLFMPRTALRYAIEKMSKELRAKAMEK